MTMLPILRGTGLGKAYQRTPAFEQVDIELWPGELLAIVGESGSGKTSLLNALSGRIGLDTGAVRYRFAGGETRTLASLPDAVMRHLHRSEWGFVRQHPRDGLRLGVSAGGNIAERLIASGLRRFADLRDAGEHWMDLVEIGRHRVDDLPRDFSGGMMQRLQIACALATNPSIVFLDEPTGGLDVSVQARILDLIRTLIEQRNTAVVLVTHDIAVARLIAHRVVVMHRGRIVEEGLTDRILEDPQHPFTQLLVSAVL